MTTTRRAAHLAVLGLAAALVSVASGPATAEPLPNSTAPTCLRPSGEAETNIARYFTRARENGNTTQVVPGGRLETDFQPLTASCPGATYTFTVSSVDGSALGWTTEATAPAGGVTSVSADGRSVTVTFTGDGATKRFDVLGSTAPAYDNHNNCLGLSLTASFAGASYTWTDRMTGQVCKEGTGAGSFYG